LRETIPISKLSVSNEDIKIVTKILKSGMLTERTGSGPNVSQFESDFAQLVRAKYAIAVNSGTAALHASLMALGIMQGDEVVVPSFTFVATAEAVALAGARPVFADIDPQTYCTDPESVEDAVTKRTKVIVPVHMFGLPSNMDAIREVAREYGIPIVEDAAQAVGAEYRENKVGTLSDMTCFSFYASKNLGVGEGGMITTNSEEYADALRMIRNHGEGRGNESVRLGHNYRMPEIVAALGRTQLQRLPELLKARRSNADAMTALLKHLDSLVLPSEPEGYKHSWYLYTVRLKGANAAKRNKVVQRLREKKIGATVYYPTPVHLMPFYRAFAGREKIELKQTEKASRQVFSIPTHSGMSQRDLEYVADTMKRVIT
jgi:perosamine synthetase